MCVPCTKYGTMCVPCTKYGTMCVPCTKYGTMCVSCTKYGTMYIYCTIVTPMCGCIIASYCETRLQRWGYAKSESYRVFSPASFKGQSLMCLAAILMLFPLMHYWHTFHGIRAAYTTCTVSQLRYNSCPGCTLGPKSLE